MSAGIIIMAVGVLLLAGALSAGSAAKKESSPGLAVFSNLVGMLILIPGLLLIFIGLMIIVGATVGSG